MGPDGDFGAQALNVVVVPAFSRPAFLSVCLHRLSLCEGISDVVVLVSIDNFGKREETKACSEVASTCGLQVQVRHGPRHAYKGNSFNVLESLRVALTLDPKLVFYVEDDVLVSRDFLSWHTMVHEQEQLFASVAAVNTNSVVAPEIDPRAYYLSKRDYAALGSCLPISSVQEVLRHAHHDYYTKPMDYCIGTFPSSTIGREFAEQDGLIRRCLEQSSKPCAWPFVPRAFHAGFYGYNRPGHPLKGPLETQVAELWSLLDNADALNARAKIYKDITPCDLNGTPCPSLVLRL